MGTPRHVVPALGFNRLTRFYDAVVQVLLKGERFKRRLVEQATLAPGHRVLDLGCGTATLTTMLKRACPAASAVGFDADPAILAAAGRNIVTETTGVRLVQALAMTLPFRRASFDRVVSILLFHHLMTWEKRETMNQLRNLLKPGGQLHIVDWGRPQNPFARIAFLLVQLLDGFASTTDNIRGLLVPMLQEAKVSDVGETGQHATVLGTLAFYQALVPVNTR